MVGGVVERKEGRKERRKEGRKEERKERRKERRHLHGLLYHVPKHWACWICHTAGDRKIIP
jgi:hypothetical protein